MTLVEELWQFGKRTNAEAMLQEVRTASRNEGAVIYVTTESGRTAGRGLPQQESVRAESQGRGGGGPSFLPVLYEWPKMVESKACLDLENAWVVNLNLGASVSKEWLRSKYDEYKSESPKAFQTFAAKHLNVEIGLALGV